MVVRWFGHVRVARARDLAAAAALLVVAGVAASAENPAHVGSARCAQCHRAETEAWQGSHHDLAMAEATEQTVLGDFDDAAITVHGVTSRFYRKGGRFFVRTDGPDGELRDYPIRYTFGWYPLQQYLIEFPRGHLQALGLAWDSRLIEDGQRWFHLYPDEELDARSPLHWTGRDQTWNYQCAECHSTNLRKGYDFATDSYATTFDEINVACEACHGPGSDHVAWAQAAAADPAKASEAGKGLVVDLADRGGASWVIDPDSGKPRRSAPRSSRAQLEVCARCHSRRGQIAESYQHGKPLGNTHRLSLLDEQLYFPDGQVKDEVYVYGSFIQSRMYSAGVTCSDCHRPHSLELRAEGNAVCGRCHASERYDTESHHRHQRGSPGAACAACHMPQRTYMIVDERADHSLRVPRPDLSLALGTPNACNQCHVEKSIEWAANAVAGWYPNSTHRGPHFGQVLHAAARGSSDAAARLLALAADPTQPAIARATAVERMRDYAHPSQLPTVQRLLEAPDALLRRAAVRYLDVTDLRTRVDSGWPLLNDPERAVRIEAARVLAPLLRQRLPEQYRKALGLAVEEYAQALWVNAERPDAHLNLGLVATAAGDAERAEAAYRTALRLDPGFTPGYANLADLMRELGRDEEGEQVLRTGIVATPADADLRHALGLLLVRQERLPDALPPLREAAELAEDQPRYAYVYALALQGAGESAQAINVLARAHERHRGNRDILVALASMHRDRGEHERARRYAEMLADRFPQDQGARALLDELRDLN